MQTYPRQLKIIHADKSKKLAAELIALSHAQILEYIETMASGLSVMAFQSDETLLGDLLNLASMEASSGKDRKRSLGPVARSGEA
jgi:hypothetical protein